MGFEYKRVKRNNKRDYYWIGVQQVDWKAIEDGRTADFNRPNGRTTREAGMEIRWSRRHFSGMVIADYLIVTKSPNS